MLEKFISFISGKFFRSRFSVTLWKAKWLPSSLIRMKNNNIIIDYKSLISCWRRYYRYLVMWLSFSLPKLVKALFFIARQNSQNEKFPDLKSNSLTASATEHMPINKPTFSYVFEFGARRPRKFTSIFIIGGRLGLIFAKAQWHAPSNTIPMVTFSLFAFWGWKISHYRSVDG